MQRRLSHCMRLIAVCLSLDGTTVDAFAFHRRPIAAAKSPPGVRKCLLPFRQDLLGHKNGNGVSFPSKASTDHPKNTYEFFHQSAEKWMQADLDYYQHYNKDYFPLITPETGVTPPLDHLEAAIKEFARRFADEVHHDEEHEISYVSPFLLVATNVRDDWSAPKLLKAPVRFILLRSESTKHAATLFIKSMTGSTHGMLDAGIAMSIDAWICSNKLHNIVVKLDAGGDGYQPDKAYRPFRRDRLDRQSDVDPNLSGRPQPRIVIETEHFHMSGRQIRQVGFGAMKNEYTRLFMGIKLWLNDEGDDFAVGVVLWGKDEDGQITVLSAHDVGTRPMSSLGKNPFEEDGLMDMLPPVKKWTRPKPSSPYESIYKELDSLTMDETSPVEIPEDPDWVLTLPAELFLYRTSTRASTDQYPHILCERSIPDCCINLQSFASLIHHGIKADD